MTWLVHLSGRTVQLSESDLVEGARSGSIPSSAFLLAPGSPRWIPLSEFVEGLEHPDARGAPLGHIPVLLIAIALLAILLVVQFFSDHIVLVLAPLSAGFAIGVHTLLLCGILALGLLMVRWAWMHPKRRLGKAPGAVAVFCILAAFVEFGIAAGAIMSSSDYVAIEEARRAEVDGFISIVGPGIVEIGGPIGPNFAKKFRAAAREAGGIELIRLSSPGGLLDQALDIADEIETNSISVLTTGECSSACILLAIASPDSWATEAALFGFHASYSVADVSSQIAIFSGEETERLHQEFLRAHGVPDRIIEAAAKHGPDSVYVVRAEEMLAMGVIEGIETHKAP